MPAPNSRLRFSSSPGPYLRVTPDLKTVAVSKACLSATMTCREAFWGATFYFSLGAP